MKYKILYIILFTVILTSCDKYLDVQPKGKVIPTKIADFDLLLNGGAYTIHTTSDDKILFLSADDVTADLAALGDISDNTNPKTRMFKWDADLFIAERSVTMWNKPYQNIYQLNVVINGIDEAIGDDEILKKSIKAEARVMRAYEYFLLVNSFAKQYDATTASSDPGVPIVTKADLAQELNGRASVQEVYNFILKDLTESVNDLPDDASGYTRAGKAAGYGIMARVYLQMGDYENAKTAATQALNYNNYLITYSTPGTDVYNTYNNEQYMVRLFDYVYGYMDGYLSDEAAALYESADARYHAHWGGKWVRVYNETTGRYEWQYSTQPRKKYTAWINHCVSTGEMYVIRAECNARLSTGTITEVLDDLNTLRRSRIYDYVDSTNVSSKEDALVFALEERRRELVPKGMRWFDLKRLNLDPTTAKTLEHKIEYEDENGPVVESYTLEPNSNRYVFPIPLDVINFNPDMVQNDRN